MTSDFRPWDVASLIDHAANQRDEASIERFWRDPRAKILEIGERSTFDLHPFGCPVTDERGPVVFLGLVDEHPWFARRTHRPLQTTVRDAKLEGLHYEIVSAALASLNWVHSTSRCATCGGVLNFELGGFAARCLECGRQTFPRTDPAVIVAVLDEQDRLYLAHHRAWDGRRVSVLAGFVEAGESAEQAVYREVLEESSLEVEACRYLASQPWPFPRSLMFAFSARTRSPGNVDGDELEWGGWYSRDDVYRHATTGRLILPMPGSIASAMITAWIGGRLPIPEG